MGLRERQKVNRHKRILDTATALFVDQGYEATKSEKIAERAEVSIGTLYNYFRSKGDILLTLVAIESERIYGDNLTLSDYPQAEPVAAYRQLFATYFGPEKLFLNRDLWRRAIALSFQDQPTEAARRFLDVDRLLCEQVVRLTETLKAKGALRQDVKSRPFATALFNNVNMLFYDYCCTSDMSMDQLHEQVAETTAAIVSLATIGAPKPVLTED